MCRALAAPRGRTPTHLPGARCAVAPFPVALALPRLVGLLSGAVVGVAAQRVSRLVTFVALVEPVGLGLFAQRR